VVGGGAAASASFSVPDLSYNTLHKFCFLLCWETAVFSIYHTLGITPHINQRAEQLAEEQPTKGRLVGQRNIATVSQLGSQGHSYYAQRYRHHHEGEAVWQGEEE